MRVLGQVSEALLVTLFQGSDLFVMPNIPVAGDLEGFGVVMLEAGLCGLPIVAAELEGIRDVVREGENGVLVSPGDAVAFAGIYGAFKPDYVIHLGAQAGVRFSAENPAAYARSNLDGFLNVLEACRRAPPKHLVFASSSSVYGAGAKVPFREDDNTDQPISF